MCCTHFSVFPHPCPYPPHLPKSFACDRTQEFANHASPQWYHPLCSEIAHWHAGKCEAQMPRTSVQTLGLNHSSWLHFSFLICEMRTAVLTSLSYSSDVVVSTLWYLLKHSLSDSLCWSPILFYSICSLICLASQLSCQLRYSQPTLKGLGLVLSSSFWLQLCTNLNSWSP